MDEVEWVPVVMFICIAIVMVAAFYFRMRGRQALQQTVRAALEQGQALSPELIEKLSGVRDAEAVDLRRGVVSISVGVALLAFAVLLDERDALRPLMAVSAFPFSVGLAYLLLWWRTRK